MRPLPAARDLSISCFVDPHPLLLLAALCNSQLSVQAYGSETRRKCGKGIAALFRPLSTPHVPLHTVVICSERLPDSAFRKALYTDKAGHMQRRGCALHCAAQCKPHSKGRPAVHTSDMYWLALLRLEHGSLFSVFVLMVVAVPPACPVRKAGRLLYVVR